MTPSQNTLGNGVKIELYRMYEAIFQIDHHSVYANATADVDVSIRMWCGRHADFLYISGRNIDYALDQVRNEIELSEILEKDGEGLAITKNCLLSHQDRLLESFLQKHNCLIFYPVKYEDGDLVTRVVSLERENLSDFFDSVKGEFDIEVRSIGEIVEIYRYPALLFESDLPDFSPRQREAIKLAFDMGYYDIPRNTTTEEIAEKLSISRRTLEEHLRWAEKRAVQSVLQLSHI